MRYWGYSKPISMLIHTSQKTLCHQAVADVLSSWVNEHLGTSELMRRCRQIYEQETRRITKELWLKEFDGYGVPPEQIRDYPAFEEIRGQLELLCSEQMKYIMMTDDGDLQYQTGLHLVIDNSSRKYLSADNKHIRLAYPEPDMDPYPAPAPAFIIIGGNTLSRGLTIEGLVSTFFLRASCQADTLMQMRRWFGYRRGYELLPRIWMTADTIEKFRFLSELEVDLREDLKKYMAEGVLPSEYGPRIRCSPKVSWLRLTSKRHMTSAKYAEMDFSGAKPQTVIFDKDVTIQKKNIEITENFLKELGSHTKLSPDKTSICWTDVELEKILNFLLKSGFTFSSRSRVFNETGAFCDWIKQVAKENVLTRWSVIVVGKDRVVTGNATDGKHWTVDGCTVGKVNRSRRKPTSDTDTTIDIGALRTLKDHIADVPDEFYRAVHSPAETDTIRKAAHMDKIPMLIIYRIDGQSKKRESSPDRQDMDMPCDIIGIQICVPGDQINKKFCKRLTIQLPEKDREEEVEDAAYGD